MSSASASTTSLSSPICRAAAGAEAYLDGSYQEAKDHFKAAVEARERWSDEVRSFHWAEDARDRYYLAMAHAALAREADGDGADLSEAMVFYGDAEAAYEKGSLTPENRDLFLAVRRKAREVLGL